jgi:hypothetical protein
MFGLLLTFSKIRSEPWYGKNASLVESLPTGFRHVELTRRHFLPIGFAIVFAKFGSSALLVKEV